MSIPQFLRILWARRWVIAAATLSCLVGALVIVLLLPPRWEARSRVMLNLMKPDPVTGRTIDGQSAGGYVATQIELIKDYKVAGDVVEDLGWLNDPELQRRYQAADNANQTDFRRWLARQIIDRTSVTIPSGSTVMEIVYEGTSPNNARLVADALMRSYVDTALEFRRQEAVRNAQWFEGQAVELKQALDKADADKNAYMRANGLVQAEEGIDIDSARLRALAQAPAASAGVVLPPTTTASPTAAMLSQLDAQIAQASQNLGPNHPELIEMRNRRSALASQLAQERSAAASARNAVASAAGASAAANERAVMSARARVLAQSDKIERLRQLQSEVNLRREQYVKATQKAAEYRQEAAVGDAGLQVLGAAATPQSPSFPNKPLIFGGLTALGLGLGVLTSILMELFGRRVRGEEELRLLLGTPVLAVIPSDNKQPSAMARLRRPGADAPAKKPSQPKSGLTAADPAAARVVPA